MTGQKASRRTVSRPVYKFLQRGKAVYQLLVKGKTMRISLERLKPARLPEQFEDKDEVSGKIDTENTKLVQRQIRKE